MRKSREDNKANGMSWLIKKREWGTNLADLRAKTWWKISNSMQRFQISLRYSKRRKKLIKEWAYNRFKFCKGYQILIKSTHCRQNKMHRNCWFLCWTCWAKDNSFKCSGQIRTKRKDMRRLNQPWADRNWLHFRIYSDATWPAKFPA